MKTSEQAKNIIRKTVVVNKEVVEQVLQHLLAEKKNPARDFSITVEQALGIWLKRDVMADCLQTIITDLSALKDAIKVTDLVDESVANEAIAKARLLVEIVLSTGAFKVVPIELPQNTPVNIRNGIDRPAPEKTEDA